MYWPLGGTASPVRAELACQIPKSRSRSGWGEMDDFAQFINLHLPGIVVGCIYALYAIGISLIFAISAFRISPMAM